MKRPSMYLSTIEQLGRLLICLCLAALALSSRPAVMAQAAAQVNLIGPAGTVAFGAKVFSLPNGNIVVVDPGYTLGSNSNVGAVFLYNGKTMALISTLTGSHTNDLVGFDIAILTNGNYVVHSLLNGVGAVTWCSSTSGCQGKVTVSNSLIGALSGDSVGTGGITALSNSNYLVTGVYRGSGSPSGAVAFCSGTSGCQGYISPSNSLIQPLGVMPATTSLSVFRSLGGQQINQMTENLGGFHELSNGNYVVPSLSSTNGTWAVTLCNGNTGCEGTVSATNSLMGTQATTDYGGSFTVDEVANGNFVVRNPNSIIGGVVNAGSVTWCSGASGCQGPVSAVNSLVGSQTNDYVGGYGLNLLEPMSNGNYLVLSYNWANGSAVNAGAVTWCSGTSSCKGVVSASNSLVGSQVNDKIGYSTIQFLPNGNYVVPSPEWSNGAAQYAGAVTWCSGTTGCQGEISTSNSLVGVNKNDSMGNVTPFSDGNYIVTSSYSGLGAVTYCSGTSGCTGTVSASNSLVGTNSGDNVGMVNLKISTKELNNGNYVVGSQGAATWCSGNSGGCKGTISASNSLVGSSVGGDITVLTNGNYVVNGGVVILCSGSGGCVGTASASAGLTGNGVGSGGITALSNGNYVVNSTGWYDNAMNMPEGAATWCSGTIGCQGSISVTNSLVGSHFQDYVGNQGVVPLPNGSYLVLSPLWKDLSNNIDGAVTWCSAVGGCQGVVSEANSLVEQNGNPLGSRGDITLLPDGDYLAKTTWCSEESGCRGIVSTANSLLGGNFAGNITVLGSGNYLVSNPNMVISNMVEAGSVTWCSGSMGCQGLISGSNSLIGSQSYDLVGSGGITELKNGDLIVESPSWANGSVQKAGAVTFLSGYAQIPVGPLTTTNSVLGKNSPVSMSWGTAQMNWIFDYVNNQLIVGSPFDNLVTILKEPVIASSVMTGNWTDQTTWDSGVPNQGTSVTIRSGHTVRINGDSVMAKDLTIQPGGSLTFTGGTLSLAGSFHNQGTFSAGGGTLIFSGNGNLTLDASGPTMFNNLIIQHGVVLVENSPGNLFSVQGALINRGTLRKSLPVNQIGSLSFGLTGVAINVTTLGGLSSLLVDRVDQNPPMDVSFDTQTGVSWTLTPTSSGPAYNLKLSLSHHLGTVPLDVCNYNNSTWDCAINGSDSASVWRDGLNQLNGIWAIGWQPSVWLFLPSVQN